MCVTRASPRPIPVTTTLKSATATATTAIGSAGLMPSSHPFMAGYKPNTPAGADRIPITQERVVGGTTLSVSPNTDSWLTQLQASLPVSRVGSPASISSVGTFGGRYGSPPRYTAPYTARISKVEHATRALATQVDVNMLGRHILPFSELYSSLHRVESKSTLSTEDSDESQETEDLELEFTFGVDDDDVDEAPIAATSFLEPLRAGTPLSAMFPTFSPSTVPAQRPNTPVSNISAGSRSPSTHRNRLAACYGQGVAASFTDSFINLLCDNNSELTMEDFSSAETLTPHRGYSVTVPGSPSEAQRYAAAARRRMASNTLAGTPVPSPPASLKAEVEDVPRCTFLPKKNKKEKAEKKVTDDVDVGCMLFQLKAAGFL